MALVSIIIPSYNRASLIPDAIRSVQRQNYPSLEMIIVDDGSTDSTKAVIAQFQKADSRIRYIEKSNGGCASARNVGLNNACGEYICLLDSDDLFMPKKLAVQASLLEHRPDIGFVYSDSFEFDDATKKVWLSRVANHGGKGDFPLKHFMTNHARSGALLYRKRIIDKVGGFREDFRYNEDSHFLQEVAMKANGCYSDYPSYLVRNHSGSKSRHIFNLIQCEQLSIELICQEFPDFLRNNAADVDARKNELMAKLFISHIMSHRLHDAYTLFANAKAPGLINGTTRLMARRIRKIFHEIRDREVIRKHLEEIRNTLTQ